MNILHAKKILPSNQKQIMEQAKFTYSPLGKAFVEQTKTIKEQGEEQVKAIKSNYCNDKQLLLSKERKILKMLNT